MKILLINPKSSNVDALPIPPLGILYLAACVRGDGFEVTVIDNNLENRLPDGLLSEITAHDIIGLTGTTSQFKQAKAIAVLAKQHGKTVVIGGPHATFMADDIIRDFAIDVVVLGEGEETFREICRALGEGRDFAGVCGIICKSGNSIVKTPPRCLIAKLDDIPFPARDLVAIERYATRELKRYSGAYTHIMSSRGCSGKCFFCSSPAMWGAPRFRSAANTFAEMLQIYEAYGIKNIHFQDDAFTSAKKRVHELCHLINLSGIDFKWSCQARPDHVSYEMLMEMKRSGCAQVEFGIESGDAALIKSVKKGYTKEQIRQAFQWAKAAGITTQGFFVVGLPGETVVTWVKSMLFAWQLKMDRSAWSVLVPFPGTRIYDEKLVEIVEPEFLEWRYKNAVIKTGWLGPRTLMLMRKVADMICNGYSNIGTYKK